MSSCIKRVAYGSSLHVEISIGSWNVQLRPQRGRARGTLVPLQGKPSRQKTTDKKNLQNQNTKPETWQKSL